MRSKNVVSTSYVRQIKVAPTHSHFNLPPTTYFTSSSANFASSGTKFSSEVQNFGKNSFQVSDGDRRLPCSVVKSRLADLSVDVVVLRTYDSVRPESKYLKLPNSLENGQKRFRLHLSHYFPKTILPKFVSLTQIM